MKFKTIVYIILILLGLGVLAELPVIGAAIEFITDAFFIIAIVVVEIMFVIAIIGLIINSFIQH